MTQKLDRFEGSLDELIVIVKDLIGRVDRKMLMIDNEKLPD